MALYFHLSNAMLYQSGLYSPSGEVKKASLVPLADNLVQEIPVVANILAECKTGVSAKGR